MEEADEEQLLLNERNKYTHITELKLLLAARNQRIQELKNKAKETKEKIQGEETEKLTVTRALQEDCDLKEKSIKDLEANIEKLEVHMTDSKEQRKLRYDEQIKQIEADKDKELADIIIKRQSTEKELAKIEEYKTKQAIKQRELEALKRENEAKLLEIKNIEYTEQMEIIKRKERLKEEYKQKVELEKEKAKLEAEK
jgi:hypothetical protein